MPRRLPPIHPAALLAFAVYLGGGVVLGDTFPFSRFSMYSVAGGARDQGAVPVFLADGTPQPVEAFEAFHGLEPSRYAPPRGIPCSLEYRVQDMARWVAAHPAERPGPVRAELAFVILEQQSDGSVHQTIEVISSGWAERTR